jgi:hypothetical protein
MNTTITKLNNTQIEIKFYLIIRMNEYFNLRLKLMLPKPVLAKCESLHLQEMFLRSGR